MSDDSNDEAGGELVLEDRPRFEQDTVERRLAKEVFGIQRDSAWHRHVRAQYALQTSPEEPGFDRLTDAERSRRFGEMKEEASAAERELRLVQDRYSEATREHRRLVDRDTNAWRARRHQVGLDRLAAKRVPKPIPTSRMVFTRPYEMCQTAVVKLTDWRGR